MFEVFHNFVALSQWGNTIYNIMLKLAKDTGDPEARAWFKKTMEGNPDDAGGKAFTPLERFVMELFRTITPNGGSISAMAEVRTPPYRAARLRGDARTRRPASIPCTGRTRRTSTLIVTTPRRRAMRSTRRSATRSASRAAPSTERAFEVKDGRKATIHNSGFGTVYGIVDGKPLPVCDHAGFAPFGFGYRRCPGEQLTIQVFEDFLRKVWKSGIEFQKLDIANPEPLPIGPTTVIGDNVGFTKAA